MRWRKLSMENSLWKGRCAKRFGNANLTNGAYKKLQLRYGSYLTCWKDWYAFRSQFRREVAGTIDVEGTGRSFGGFLYGQRLCRRLYTKILLSSTWIPVPLWPYCQFVFSILCRLTFVSTSLFLGADKSLIIDFVCRSQPEQYSQYVDRRPVKMCVFPQYIPATLAIASHRFEVTSMSTLQL
jgi:hypothetical protein